MRASPVFRSLTLATVVVVAAIWFYERDTAAKLQDRLVALGKEEQHLRTLRAERDRLQDELDASFSLRSSAASTVAPTRELNGTEASGVPAALVKGEWTPVAAWKNEGRSTPGSTVTTLLWAAAGGDLAATRAVLEFDETARAAIRDWFETMPPATRSLYASPEDLFASVTMKNITPTAAQLTWFNQTDSEHAVIGVLLSAPESATPLAAPTFVKVAADAPPGFLEQNKNRLALLSLRRTADGWRVVVPVTAINNMKKMLRVPSGP